MNAIECAVCGKYLGRAMVPPPKPLCSDECREVQRAADLLSCYGEPDLGSLLEQSIKLSHKMMEQSGQTPDMLIVHPETYQKLEECLGELAPQSRPGQLGYQTMEIAGMKVMPDVNARKDRMFAIHNRAPLPPITFPGSLKKK